LIQTLPELVSLFTRPVETTTSDCLVRSLDLFHKMRSFIFSFPFLIYWQKKSGTLPPIIIVICIRLWCLCVCVYACVRMCLCM